MFRYSFSKTTNPEQSTVRRGRVSSASIPEPQPSDFSAVVVASARSNDYSRAVSLSLLLKESGAGGGNRTPIILAYKASA